MLVLVLVLPVLQLAMSCHGLPPGVEASPPPRMQLHQEECSMYEAAGKACTNERYVKLLGRPPANSTGACCAACAAVPACGAWAFHSPGSCLLADKASVPGVIKAASCGSVAPFPTAPPPPPARAPAGLQAASLTLQRSLIMHDPTGFLRDPSSPHYLISVAPPPPLLRPTAPGSALGVAAAQPSVKWTFVGFHCSGAAEATPVYEGGPPGDAAEVRFFIARAGRGVSLYSVAWAPVNGSRVAGPSGPGTIIKSDDEAPRGSSGSPRGVDPQTDCALRKEVWAYAQHLLPRKKRFAEMYDALQLGNLCTGPAAVPRPPHADDGPWAPPAAAPPGPLAAAGALMVFADAQHGSDDAGRGTEQSPLRSLEAAVAAVRAARRAGGGGNATVLLREGVYFLRAPITLTSADSNLTIENYPNETAVVSGGEPLPDLRWHPLQPLKGSGPAAATASWTLYNDSNNVNGQVRPGRDAVCCKYVGTSKDVAGCEAALASSAKRPASGWTSFTWQPASAGSYAHQCYGIVTSRWAPAKQRGFISGRHGAAPPAPAPGPSPTQRFPIVAATVAAGVGLGGISGLRVNGERAILARYP